MLKSRTDNVLEPCADAYVDMYELHSTCVFKEERQSISVHGLDKTDGVATHGARQFMDHIGNRDENVIPVALGFKNQEGSKGYLKGDGKDVQTRAKKTLHKCDYCLKPFSSSNLTVHRHPYWREPLRMSELRQMFYPAGNSR